MYDALHQLLRLAYPLHTETFGNWSDTSQPVIVLVHGIGVNHRIWQRVINSLADYPVLAVDLLGFGDSRKPRWPDYSLNDHARALRKTLNRHIPGRRIVLCGHSLGSLIAIEYARIAPHRVERLILCSPPIYTPKDLRKQPLREAMVKLVGRSVLKALHSLPHMDKVVNQYRAIQKNFYVSPSSFSPYTKSARNSILLQTSLDDIIALPPLPIDIIYGTLDTVMVPAHFRTIQRRRSGVTQSTIVAGHEIRARYAKVIAQTIMRHEKTKH